MQVGRTGIVRNGNKFVVGSVVNVNPDSVVVKEAGTGKLHTAERGTFYKLGASNNPYELSTAVTEATGVNLGDAPHALKPLAKIKKFISRAKKSTKKAAKKTSKK